MAKGILDLMRSGFYGLGDAAHRTYQGVLSDPSVDQWRMGVGSRMAELLDNPVRFLGQAAADALPSPYAPAAMLAGTQPSESDKSKMMNLGILGITLPGVASVHTKAWRGGKSPMDGQFYSRDASYAKGFDKGDYRQYQIAADSALNMNQAYSAKTLAPVIKSLREIGDAKAATEIERALAEDGGAIGGHLYTWLERLSSHSPEEILRRAGFDVIDTGRDLRVLNPRSVTQ